MIEIKLQVIFSVFCNKAGIGRFAEKSQNKKLCLQKYYRKIYQLLKSFVSSSESELNGESSFTRLGIYIILV